MLGSPVMLIYTTIAAKRDSRVVVGQWPTRDEGCEGQANYCGTNREQGASDALLGATSYRFINLSDAPLLHSAIP